MEKLSLDLIHKDNIAIRGTAIRNINEGKDVLSSAIEHISVINPMKDLQKNGWIYNTIPVDSYGLVDLSQLEKLLSIFKISVN